MISRFKNLWLPKQFQARAEAFLSPKAGQAESVKTFSDQEKECGALATRRTASLGGAEVTDAQQSSPGIPSKRRVFPMVSWRNPWWIESEYYVRLIVDFKKLDPTPVTTEFPNDFPSSMGRGLASRYFSSHHYIHSKTVTTLQFFKNFEISKNFRIFAQ